MWKRRRKRRRKNWVVFLRVGLGERKIFAKEIERNHVLLAPSEEVRADVKGEGATGGVYARLVGQHCLLLHAQQVHRAVSSTT
jgi:hypothetical protein